MPTTRPRFLGLTLVELMISLAVGSVIVIGAVRAFSNGRSVYRLADSVARLEENARFALAVVERDVSMAGFWGLTNRANSIEGRAGATGGVEIEVSNDCGDDWAIDLDSPLAATSNAYTWTCGAYADRARDGADTLVVRRVAASRATRLEAGRLYVRTRRSGHGRIVLGPNDPPSASPDSGVPGAEHELLVRGYYVSETSTLSTPGNAVPSLRRKILVGGSLGPRIVDEEVLPGIEDMQIQLGIDLDPRGNAGRGAVDVFVDPGSSLLEDTESVPARVLAVRIWLLARAEEPEVGFVDARRYAYADRVFEPPRDGYRRELSSLTVFVRNTWAERR
jgi:type IV pilus assembly protein PilW